MTDDVKNRVVELVAKVMQTTVKDIMSLSRKDTEPRHLCMYLMQHCLKIGPIEIARYFDQNHATVYHSKKKVEGLFEAYPVFLSQYNQLREMVKNLDVADIQEEKNAELLRLYTELKHENRRLKSKVQSLEEENTILRKSLPIKVNVA